MARKPNGYWTLENILAEARKIVKEKGYMPTHQELMEMGRGDLSSAIFKMGGIKTIRETLGCPKKQDLQPKIKYNIRDNAKKTSLMKEVEEKIGEPLEKWLDNEHHNKGNSTETIGKSINLPGFTISRWLSYFGIPTRNTTPLEKNSNGNKEYSTIGDLIKGTRLERRLSRIYLSRETGLTINQISRFDYDNYLTPKRNLLKILNFLEIKPEIYLKIAPELKESRIDYSQINTLGELLKESRKQKGLTKMEITKMAGIDYFRYCVWENDKEDPSGKSANPLQKLLEIINILQIPPEQAKRFLSFYGNPNNLGELIKKFRVKKGINLTELEKISGIDQRKMSEYERNTYRPNKENMKKMTEILEIPEKEILKYFPGYNQNHEAEIIKLLKESDHTLTEIGKKTNKSIKLVWGVERRAIKRYNQLKNKGLSEEELEKRTDVLNSKYKRINGLKKPSKEELEQKYKELGSTAKVGEYYKVNGQTALNWMKYYGIETNKSNSLEQTVNIYIGAGK